MQGNKLTVALFRVSSDEQEVLAQSRPVQEEIKKRGLTPVKLVEFRKHREAYQRQHQICVVVEEVGTGRNANREGYQWMMGELRAGRLASILCYKVDRINRNVHNSAEIATLCREKKTELYSCTQHFDLFSAAGKFTYDILCAVAALESELISERTKEGLAYWKKVAQDEGREWDNGGRKVGFLTKPVRKIIPLFIELLDMDTSVRHAAKVCGISRKTAYRLKKRLPELKASYPPRSNPAKS